MSTLTLVAVDTLNHDLTINSLKMSTSKKKFDQVLFITDKNCNTPGDWRIEKISTFKNSNDYNHFILKDLCRYIETDYILVQQYDSGIINPDAWNDKFFEYDYIGAPWWFLQEKSDQLAFLVGNGGFSLRSKKLLLACQEDRIKLTGHNKEPLAEDATIRIYHSFLQILYDIRFAPVEIASKFSFESRLPTEKVFGFHGFANLNQLYSIENKNFSLLLCNITPIMCTRFLTLYLAIQYINTGKMQEASLLIKKTSEYTTKEQARHVMVSTVKNMHQDFDRFWNLQKGI